MTWAAWQRYLAEFVGTFALLLFGGGAAVFTLGDAAFDPLSRVAVVSLAFGFILVALAYAFGDISGGHFNPAVTISMAVSRRMPALEVIPYLVAQVLGGLTGISVVAAIASGSSALPPIS
ncbi:MAG TPA: aquaporin, partial [Thermoplasmata archaeon]|nr:aquaporin [Thermoplasmata archaeon]